MGLQTAFKGLLAIGGILAIGYISVCVFLYLRQNRFIFFPASEIESTPAEFQLVYEDVWLPVLASNGKVERIHGWWIPASAPTNRVLLYLHGNGVNVGANVHQAYRFHKLGFSVFLFDYRGYGQSEGEFPTEKTAFQDAESVWDYLTQERGISPQQIALYGHSLGGAIAIDLAIRHPDAAGAIVQSSFTSMREMVDYRFDFWMFPIDLLLTHRFDSISKVKHLKMPVLFMHGTADGEIPSTMTEALYAAAPEPKRLFLVPGAEHNNVASTAGEKFFKEVREFIGIAYKK